MNLLAINLADELLLFLSGLIPAIIGFYFVYCLLVYPFESWLSDKYQAYPVVSPLTKENGAPAETLEFHEHLKHRMENLGFENVLQVMLNQMVKGTIWAAQSLYQHPQFSECAIVTSYFDRQSNSGNAHDFHYFQFIAEYEDGPWRQVETTNFSLPGIFPCPPQRFNCRMPHVKDLEVLYELHRRCLELVVPGQQAVLDSNLRERDDAIRYLLDKTGIEDFEQSVKEGYLRKTQGGKIYRLTLRGAFRASWMAFFPARQIIQSGIRKDGIRIEEQLRAGTIDSYLNQQPNRQR